MLFPYIYVPHQMEKMQSFINFIFYQVWCRANKAGVYDLSLFDANPPLKELMTIFAFGHTKEGDKFSTQIQAIYQSFAGLSRLDVAQFKRWYQGNNDVQKVCDNDPSTHLARYADIAINHQNLAEQLSAFFKGLYSPTLLNLAALRAKIGDIDDHYQSFMQTNKAHKCPFCGINDLLGENHNKREAYDHYLPKAIYPFNSINFKNLVPACHHCNSSYKTSKDPAYTPKDPARLVHRRAVFYPYSTAPHVIDITVELTKADVANLTPADFNLHFGPEAVNEQIETWKDIYGIEERYKAKLCSTDATDWIEQFRILNRRSRFPASDHLDDIEQAAPYANCNFLKKAFMQECHRIGLLTTIEKYRDDTTEENRSV